MALAFDDDGVDVFHRGTGIGDDGALGNLPVSIEGVVAELVDADGDAIEIEIGKLAIGGWAEVNPAISAEGEEVHEDGVVGVVDGEGEGARGDYGVNNATAVATFDEALVGWVHMAMEDPRNVIAMVDANELTAERIAIAVLKEDLLAGEVARGVEVHGQVLTEESEGGEGDALGGFGFGNLDSSGVFDDFGGVVQGLPWVPELQAAELRGAFDGDERRFFIFDAEDAANRLGFVRVAGAASDGAMHADEGNIHFEDEAAVDGIRLVRRFNEESGASWRGPVDCFLEGFFVGCWSVRGMDTEFPDAGQGGGNQKIRSAKDGGQEKRGRADRHEL